MTAPAMSTTPERHPTIVWLLIVGTVFVVMTRSMSMPFLAIYLHRRMGLDAAQIGLLIGSGALVGTLGGFFGGYLSDSFGRKKILISCLTASGALFLALYFASNAIEVFIVNLAISLASSFYDPVSKATISDNLAPERRLKAFARRYVAINIGFAIGPLIGAWLGLLDNPVAFLLSSVVYLLIAVLMAMVMRGSVRHQGSAEVQHENKAPQQVCAKWRTVAGDRRLLLLTLASVLTISVHGEMSATFSQYLVFAFRDGLTMFAWLMSVNAITVVVSQPLLSRLGERNGPMTSIALGVVLLAAGAIGFAHATAMASLVVSMIVFTWGEVLLVPAEYAILDRITPEALRGTYYGVHSLSNAGNLLGPWLGGLLLIHYGGLGLFYSMAAVAILSVVLFVAGVRLKPSHLASSGSLAEPPAADKRHLAAFHAARAGARMLLWRLSRPWYRRRERTRVELIYQGHPVAIERDAAGVPLITSACNIAVTFGQGYAMATDRLWQMDVLRRQALGRLSEVFGTATIAVDRYHRTLRLGHFATESLSLLSTKARQSLQAFCDGINAAAERLQREGLAMPIEFKLLHYRPESWRPADSVAVLKLMSLQLSMNAKYKSLMHELLKDLSDDEVTGISAHASAGDYVTLTGAALARDLLLRPERSDGSANLQPLLHLLGQSHATGSNGWVVAGRHTSTGRPILCNDPHLPFALPAVLHQSHLRCTDAAQPFDALGVNVPGMPGLIAGHNGDIAWGITNSQVDVQDLLFVEAEKPATGFAAFMPGRSREAIVVRGGKPVELDVEFTTMGPALNDLCGDSSGDKVVLAWSGLVPGRDIECLFELHRASEWGSFKAALSHLHSLSLNVLFAARTGDIGFKTTGRIPLRAFGVKHAPCRNHWLGFIDFDELPELFNPPNGIIVNGNNPIAGEGHPHVLTVLWNPSYRAQRINDLLSGRSGLSLQDMEEVLQDDLNLHARQLLPRLIPHLQLLCDRRGARFGEAVAVLAAWDHRDRKDSVAPLLWQRMFDALTLSIYGNRLGSRLPFFENRLPATTRLILGALAGSKSPWLADTDELAQKTAQALQTAIESLPARGFWPRWGEAHQLGFRHLLSSHLGALRRWTDLAAQERSGSAVTVALNAGSPDVTEGAVWSMAASFSATGALSRTRLLPGQSGDFRSQWYGDQFEAARVPGHHLRRSGATPVEQPGTKVAASHPCKTLFPTS